MTDPHVDHDDLVSLALRSVGPGERERLSDHLAACGDCRAAYSEIEDAVQHTLTAAPATTMTASTMPPMMVRP